MTLERQKRLNFLPEMQSKVTTDCDNSSGTEYKTWGLGWVYSGYIYFLGLDTLDTFVTLFNLTALKRFLTGRPAVNFRGQQS